MPVLGNSHSPKMDHQAAAGLAGTAESLSYQIHELSNHHHSFEDWFGLADVPDAELHRADNVLDHVLANPIDPFVVDAGNEVWGAWVQILGSSDTPERTSMVFFDLHRIGVVATGDTATPYFLEISAGATAAAGVAAGDFATLEYFSATNQSAQTPIESKMERIAVTTKVWARVLAMGQNTSTFSFYFGLHEYPG